jgi:peptidoglycan hydrolase-like protein with peptidoglycan-binding domain
MVRKLLTVVVLVAFMVSLAQVGFAYQQQQNTISKYQKSLSALGYYKGEPTGTMDEATIAAIKACQRKCGMEPTGKLDKPTCQMIWGEVQKELAPTEGEIK